MNESQNPDEGLRTFGDPPFRRIAEENGGADHGRTAAAFRHISQTCKFPFLVFGSKRFERTPDLIPGIERLERFERGRRTNGILLPFSFP